MAYKLNMGAGPGTGVEASPAIIELAGGQRPPQLGHRRSGGTHRRDVNDHLSSATGGAAALLFIETSTTTSARLPAKQRHPSSSTFTSA